MNGTNWVLIIIVLFLIVVFLIVNLKILLTPSYPRAVQLEHELVQKIPLIRAFLGRAPSAQDSTQQWLEWRSQLVKYVSWADDVQTKYDGLVELGKMAADERTTWLLSELGQVLRQRLAQLPTELELRELLELEQKADESCSVEVQLS